MILSICQAHDFDAEKSIVLIVRLDSGMTSSLFVARHVQCHVCFGFPGGCGMDELLGNLKHLGMPAKLSLHQALIQHLGYAKAKLGTAE